MDAKMRRNCPTTVAYLVSRFPTVTETFILNEMIILEKWGLDIIPFPLISQKLEVSHPLLDRFINKTRSCAFGSWSMVRAQLLWLIRKPICYLGNWFGAIQGNLSSPRFLVRALVVVPIGAWIASEIVRADIRHIHVHWATRPALAAWCVKRLCGTSYTLTVHAHDIYVRRPMLRKKLEEAGAVVTISDFNKKYLTELYGESISSKIHVIRCGVDPDLFAPAGADVPMKPPLIVCVASLEEYKGHRYLIEACALLKKKEIPFRCWLVGGGRLKDVLKSQVHALGLQRDVRLLGPAAHNRVRRVLSLASLAVQPSVVTARGRMEGIPVALMESMSVGLPVVATDISGLSELIDDGVSGCLVPPRNTIALADAMNKLLQDKDLRQKMGAAGRETVRTRYNLEKNVDKLRHLLNGFLDKEGEKGNMVLCNFPEIER